MRQFVVEKSGEHKNKLNLKLKGLAPVVDAARVMGLDLGLRTTNTMARLEACADHKFIDPGFLSEIDDAYDFINFIRISHHLKARAEGEDMTNFIDPALLNSMQRKILKESFTVVSHLQELISIKYMTKLMGA